MLSPKGQLLTWTEDIFWCQKEHFEEGDEKCLDCVILPVIVWLHMTQPIYRWSVKLTMAYFLHSTLNSDWKDMALVYAARMNVYNMSHCTLEACRSMTLCMLPLTMWFCVGDGVSYLQANLKRFLSIQVWEYYRCFKIKARILICVFLYKLICAADHRLQYITRNLSASVTTGHYLIIPTRESITKTHGHVQLGTLLCTKIVISQVLIFLGWFFRGTWNNWYKLSWPT